MSLWKVKSLWRKDLGLVNFQGKKKNLSEVIRTIYCCERTSIKNFQRSGENVGVIITVARIFFSVGAMVLGHTPLKNVEVDQTEWWTAKQGLWSHSKAKQLHKAPKEGGTPEGLATGVSKSRGFYGLVS